jgi:hypothetical protein
MRKFLLFSLIMCFGLFAVAQKSYQLKPDVKLAKINIEQKMTGNDPVAENPTPVTSTKHAGNHVQAPDNTDIVTIVNIGSAANIYTYGYSNGNATYVWYNKDINTVTNLHRMGGPVGPTGQYSGDLAYDVSFDGGATWTNQVKVYTSDISGGTYNLDAARYPEGAIYNPAGNTDPNNAYMAFFAATMDGSNGGTWGSYGYGVGRFGDILDTTKHLLSADLANGYYQGIPTAFCVAGDGKAWMADASLLDSYTTYMGDIIFMRGIFNEGIGDYEYDEFLVPAPCNYARYLKMAFDPTGQTGYVYWNDYNGSIPESQGWPYPLLIKTTDGGENWSDVISVRLFGPDGIAGIKNWLSDSLIALIWNPPLPTRDEIMYSTPFFNSDIAVDAWGNPHLTASVFIAGPGLDTGYIATTPESFGIFDIYSIDDNNTNWQAIHLGTLATYTGDFLYPGSTALTEYNRASVSSTTDGKFMFFTWLDTRLTGVTTNVSPDIYARGFDLVENMITNDQTSTNIAGATNVTTFSEAMWQAYFQSLSATTKDEGEEGSKVYTLPITYADMDPQDVTQPVQFKYIQDFSYADGDFTLPTGNEAITGVGISENKNNNIASVSQNYPNPFNNVSTIVVNLVKAGDLSLKVTNLTGQTVFEINKGQVNSGSQTIAIDAMNLKAGAYFYTVTSNGSSVTRKMIIE